MAASYDERARATAARVLAPKPKGKGQAVTVTAPGAPSYDPATGVTTPGTPASQTGSGVVEKYSAQSIDGARIKTGDIKLLLSALQTNGAALERPVADKHTATLANGVKWRIVKVDAEEPAGVPICYTLQLRP